jgi:hypothetical protein
MGATEAVQDPAGERTAEDARHRNRCEKDRCDAASPVRRIPIGQVQQHARDKSGFGEAEQKAQGVEHHRRGHEGHGARDHCPGNHNTGNPEPGAYFVHDDIARYLEQDIAEEEDTGPETVDGPTEIQFF